MTTKEMIVVKEDPDKFAERYNEFSQMIKSRKRRDNHFVVGVEYQYFAMPKGESFGFIVLELEDVHPGSLAPTVIDPDKARDPRWRA